MRFADSRETLDIIDRLRQPVDDDIIDRDAAISTIDSFIEWTAGSDSVRAQVAYRPGDPVHEWEGLRASTPLCYATPAAALNSLLATEMDGTALVFTDEGPRLAISESSDEAR